jgi:hypothetical protein
MRKKVVEIALFVIGFISLMGVVGRVGYYETRYTMECEVTKNYMGNVEFTDKAGHIWSVDDDSLVVGDTYKVLFHTNGTDTRYDDMIEKYEKK